MFALNLDEKLGSESSDIRPGLERVETENAEAYLDFMACYKLDTQELNVDYSNLSTNEKDECVDDFFPTVLIDFDSCEVQCSHSEELYLRIDRVPEGWIYGCKKTVLPRVPFEYKYWLHWSEARLGRFEK